jgi:DNA-binding XRE family transcriptional regulator
MKRQAVHPVSRLEMLRRERGLTHDELAHDAGTVRHTIWRAEAGLGYPGLLTAIRIARRLGVTVEELWGEEAG